MRSPIRSAPPSPPRAYLPAAACLAAAALLVWAAWSGSRALRAPAAVAYAAAWVLLLAALATCRAGRRPDRPGDGPAALLAGSLAGLGAWIAFGPGPRACTLGSGGRAAEHLSGLACRVPFGVGAALVALLAGHAARRWHRGRRESAGRAARRAVAAGVAPTHAGRASPRPAAAPPHPSVRQSTP